MTERRVIVEGDTEGWTDCPEPHLGGGTYSINPTAFDQGFVTINDKRVILKGQAYPGHVYGTEPCIGYAGALGASGLVTINGTAIVRDGDAGADDCHGLLGANSVQQDFVSTDE